MATIATTTNSSPFIYPSNTLLDRDPLTGYLYCLVKASTADTYTIYRSTNGGTSWASYASTTRTSVQELGSIYIGKIGYLHWVYRTSESSQDRIYVRGLRLSDAAWQTELLLANPSNGGVAGAYHTGIDLWSTFQGTTEYFVFAVGTVVGVAHGVTLYGAFTYPGIPTVADNTVINGTRQWLHTGSGRITPSLDGEHNADGKTSSTPHLWLAFGRTKVRLVKLSWIGDGWSGPTSAVEVVSSMTARDWVAARWDGSRYLITVPNPSNTSTVAVYERNRANSSTTTRTTPTHPAGVVRSVAVNFNSVNGDIRVFAVATSDNDLYYVDYVRATSSWTSWATVSTSDVLGAGVDNFGVRRSTYSTSKHHVYHAVSGAPNTLTETQQGLAYAPTAPTWVSPTNGVAADVNATLLLDWQFNDPDPADLQSAYALRRQIGAGALAYFRASDQTWQATEQKNTSGTTERTLASAWGAGADANHTYAVKTWDVADTASAYSDGLVIIPSVKVNPTLTAPAEAGTITADTVAMTWTVSEQTAFRAILTQAGATVYDSGWVTSTATSHTPAYVLSDGVTYVASIQTRNNEGLESTADTNTFTVDFIEPMTPTLVCTAVPASGWIAVVITNPTPSGGAPALASQDLYRRMVGDTDTGVRVGAGLASGATVNDWRAVSGKAYEYRAHAFGANGTSTYSAWTA